MRGVVVRMHHGDRGVVGPQEIAAVGELLDRVAEGLEQGPPRRAAVEPDAFDGGAQALRVRRRAQPRAYEVRGQQVLDPQAGNHGLFEAGEFSGQERGGLVGLPAVARLQQVEDAAGGQLPHGPGVLRPDDPDRGGVVRRGEHDDGIGLAALSRFPHLAECGFGSGGRGPHEVIGRRLPRDRGTPGLGRPGGADAEGGFETCPGREEQTTGASRMASPNRSSVPFSRSGNGLVHLCHAEPPSPLSLRCSELVEGSKRTPMSPRPPPPAFRQAQGPSPTPLSSMCLPCPEPLEVLLGKCLVTLRGTKSAPPARVEGWRRLSRYLPERLFDERAKRHAAGTGIPFGEAANPRPR